MSQLICPNCGVANRTNARFCSECGTTLPMPPPSQPTLRSLKPGQMLQGRYRIEIELGRGGFGAVYRAWDSNLNRWCAVKENLQISTEAERQFAREATVLANISHPNLPRVIDHFFITDQGQYLVMDFVEGQDLASLVERQNTVSLDQGLKWISQVADALVYLHSLDTPIFHRDIKPANIRITPKGQAMLVDFGLVKISEPHAQTTVGARAITPGYAPPEQYGRGSTDARTDVYALAATLYRVLSGKEPPESVQRLSGAAIPPLSQINPSIPAYIGKVIEHAMALDPGQRYQSTAEFKNALTEGQTVMVQGPPARVGRPAVAGVPRTIAVQESGMPQAQSRAYTGAAQAERPAGGSGTRLLMLGGGAIVVILLVVVAIGLGGWLIVSNQMSTNSTEKARNTSTALAMAQATSTGSALNTASAQVALTQTAAPVVAATARAEATLSAQVFATQTAFAFPTANPTENYINSLLAGRSLIYGPTSGSLVHDTGDDSIELLEAVLSVTNFVVEARFDNPYATSVGAWASGLVFNGTDDNQIRFVFGSDTFWEVDLFPPNDAPQESIADGYFDSILTGETESNLVRLIRQADQGWLYINDQYVTEVSMAELPDLETIWIATGMYGDPATEFAGETTGYTDFTIWTLP